MGDGEVEKVSEPALGMKNQKRRRKGRGVGGWQFRVQIKGCPDNGSQWWFYRRAGLGEVSRQMCLKSGERLRAESDGLCTVILQERRLERAEDGTWQQEEEKK